MIIADNNSYSINKSSKDVQNYVPNEFFFSDSEIQKFMCLRFFPTSPRIGSHPVLKNHFCCSVVKLFLESAHATPIQGRTANAQKTRVHNRYQILLLKLEFLRSGYQNLSTYAPSSEARLF